MRGKGEWIVEQWETVAVTALPPDWRNVYGNDDGSVFTSACPALLLQEHREDKHFENVERDGGLYTRTNRVRTYDPPYETQVAFAAADEFGYLGTAAASVNYLGTAGPGEDPSVFVANKSEAATS